MSIQAEFDADSQGRQLMDRADRAQQQGAFITRLLLAANRRGTTQCLGCTGHWVRKSTRFYLILFKYYYVSVPENARAERLAENTPKLGSGTKSKARQCCPC